MVHDAHGRKYTYIRGQMLPDFSDVSCAQSVQELFEHWIDCWILLNNFELSAIVAVKNCLQRTLMFYFCGGGFIALLTIIGRDSIRNLPQERDVLNLWSSARQTFGLVYFLYEV